jgi:hypothetical protein
MDLRIHRVHHTRNLHDVLVDLEAGHEMRHRAMELLNESIKE